MSVPIGDVTFLFSDIEGSTKLWEAHPEAMRGALARHDALLRKSIADANGYVFKTIGDAFCAAFSLASEAVLAALQAQQALRERIGSPLPPREGYNFLPPEFDPNESQDEELLAAWEKGIQMSLEEALTYALAP